VAEEGRKLAAELDSSFTAQQLEVEQRMDKSHRDFLESQGKAYLDGQKERLLAMHEAHRQHQRDLQEKVGRETGRDRTLWYHVVGVP
jgi:hypothetical protein